MAEELWVRLSQCLSAQLGLDYPADRIPTLKKNMADVARSLNMPSGEACAEALLKSPLSPQQMQALAKHLTIGETYFFREPRVFEVISQQLLAGVLAQRAATRELKFWSAGCCTGEEPYTIAMMLMESIIDIDNWRITIAGTDINSTFLEKANNATYSAWSFRSTPAQTKGKFFKSVGDGLYTLEDRVRSMVHFSIFNLVDQTSIVPMTDADFIFCRNVLIYFNAEQAARVIARLTSCLKDNGYLVVSPSELAFVPPADYEHLHFPRAIILKKKNRAQASAKSIKELASISANATITAPASNSTAVADNLLAHFAAIALKPAPLNNAFKQQPSSAPPAATNTTPISLKATPSPRAAFPLPPAASPPASASGQQAAPRETEFRLAQDAFLAGNYQLACDKLRTLASETPPYLPALPWLVRACGNLGQLNDAAAWAQKAIDSEKLNPSHYYLLASILFDQGKRNESIAAARRAVFLEPDYVLAEFLLGMLVKESGKTEEAEKHFSNAERLLSSKKADEMVADSDGITVGHMRELINILRSK